VRPPARAAASSWIDAARSATVVRTALALRGTSYRWGGDSPTTGFDCSGLVQYVFQEEGIAVPRTVAEQFQAGMEVPQDDVAPGDLVFFSTTAAGPTHVGIAIDAYRFVHAPDTGGVVRVDAIGTPYWWSRLVGVRRVVTSAAP
jgi:cell wall-associated NlpC family hydrolase